MDSSFKDFQIQVNVPAKSVESMLVSVIEGGTTCQWLEVKLNKNRHKNNDQTRIERGCDCAADNTYHWLQCDVLTGRGWLSVKDIEAGKKYDVDRMKVGFGLYYMAKSEPWHFSQLISDNADETTADVFIQCCIFGKVIYS